MVTRMSPASFACLGLLLCAALHAFDAHGSGLRALRITAGDTPVIDGALDDPAWRRAPVYQDFHKHQPRDGAPAPGALKTSVQVLVDDGALVFGIRAWDDAPHLRRGLLARRDKVGVDQDFIGIWIDPAGHGRNAQFVRIAAMAGRVDPDADEVLVDADLVAPRQQAPARYR